MPFIDEFDALPDDDSRAKLFFRGLRTDWRGVYADLRRRRPILNIHPFLVVTRWSDVVDVLSRPRTFQVPYGPSMNESVGPFMLGHDNSEMNWRDKSVMRTLLRWDDLAGIREFAGKIAATELSRRPDPNSVDIVERVSRRVPLRIVQDCFGFPGRDETTMFRWSKATQHDMFRNLEGNQTVHQANVDAGTEMRAHVRQFIADRRPWSQLTGDDTVSRLLRMTSSNLSALDDEGVVSNICGLLVGAIETTSQAIVNATEQILLRPHVMAKAINAAFTSDKQTLDAIVWEALRFYPMATFVLRVAREPAVLAPGSDHEMSVAPGRRIAVATGSAMFDPGVFPEPDTFKPRPRDAYLHTGFGSHECLGQYVAYEIIPETIRQILLLPGVHLLPDGGSQVDYAGGPFAEHFVLGLRSNEFAINALVNRTAGRPYPFSLWSPSATKPVEGYVSWTGLVDRSYTGRHLPPAETSYVSSLPPPSAVVDLFRRQKLDGGGEVMKNCERTSALFCFFAQWFTDSFLQTNPKDRRKNTSNHEIDLCQIYGLNADTARLLRQGSGGLLRMEQRIPFPEHLYRKKLIKSDFLGLPYIGTQDAFEAAMKGIYEPAITDAARRESLYATGLERGNSTMIYTAISTVFVREHNRICAVLAKRYPHWDDDRLFETARNINTVLLLRIIVEEYINHMAATPQFRFSLQRGFAEKQNWYRTNRISLEFNLLYRWHSLVPGALKFDGKTLDASEFRFNNAILERKGVEFVLDQASRQFAGRIGLHNSPDFLIPADTKSLEMAREYRLMSYNKYRECFSLPPHKSYDQLTGDQKVSAKLQALYGADVDKVELLVGLLAEQRGPGRVLPELMATMVAVDAFSQALTNPLLANNVYGEDAFSPVGLQILDQTKSFGEVVSRNAPAGQRVGYVSFDVTRIPAADRL